VLVGLSFVFFLRLRQSYLSHVSSFVANLPCFPRKVFSLGSWYSFCPFLPRLTPFFSLFYSFDGLRFFQPRLRQFFLRPICILASFLRGGAFTVLFEFGSFRAPLPLPLQHLFFRPLCLYPSSLGDWRGVPGRSEPRYRPLLTSSFILYVSPHDLQVFLPPFGSHVYK